MTRFVDYFSDQGRHESCDIPTLPCAYFGPDKGTTRAGRRSSAERRRPCALTTCRSPVSPSDCRGHRSPPCFVALACFTPPHTIQ